MSRLSERPGDMGEIAEDALNPDADLLQCRYDKDSLTQGYVSGSLSLDAFVECRPLERVSEPESSHFAVRFHNPIVGDSGIVREVGDVPLEKLADVCRIYLHRNLDGCDYPVLVRVAEVDEQGERILAGYVPSKARLVVMHNPLELLRQSPYLPFGGAFPVLGRRDDGELRTRALEALRVGAQLPDRHVKSGAETVRDIADAQAELLGQRVGVPPNDELPRIELELVGELVCPRVSNSGVGFSVEVSQVAASPIELGECVLEQVVQGSGGPACAVSHHGRQRMPG